jgi:hypothetical protein
MALSFPDPADTQVYQYQTSDGLQIEYTWDGEKWTAVGVTAVGDGSYVKVDDEGTEQVITGGGGLNIEGDIQALDYRIDALDELL